MFRLAHISDLHLPPPPGVGPGWALKGWVSRIAWRRKRRRHSAQALAALIADLRARRPDHIAVTGDLMNFSTAPEMAQATRWLETLGPGDQVTVSPGNHDALTGARGPERFAAWTPWLGDTGDAAFPQVRRCGPVALVNLCSAAPTAPHLAQGELDAGQLARLPAMLRELGEARLCRVILIHHPPGVGAVSARKALRQAPELAAILAREGAELILHGHSHEASVASLAGPKGPIPVIGVPPASGAAHPEHGARWHEIEITDEDGAWRIGVTARGLDAAGAPREIGRYVLRS